jgi:DNA-binding transcriptional LysR family regulator
MEDPDRTTLGQALATVDLRQLRALVAVVDASSFRGAAERLGYAQSAVSHQIAALERSLEIVLIHRPGGRQAVSPTTAGLRASEHARSILDNLDRMGADMAAFRQGEGEPLRVGVFQTASAYLLPAALRRFHQRNTHAQLRFYEEYDCATLLRMLDRGELDLTFAGGDVPADHATIETHDLIEDNFVVLTWRGSPLSGRRKIALEALHEENLIAWQTDVGYQNDLELYWRAHGIAPRIVYRTNDNFAIHRAVEAQLGHACIGRLAARRPANRALIAIPISDPLPPRTIQICLSRGRRQSPTARALLADLMAATGNPRTIGEHAGQLRA